MNTMQAAAEPSLAEARTEAKKQKIMDAVVAILKEGGGSALTMDAIAARARTSKATIYRYWPDKTSLLIDAASRIIRSPEIPDLGSFRDELRMLLQARLKEFRGEGVDKMFGALIGVAAEDPVFGAHLREWMELQQMSTNTAIVARAKARGEIRPEVPVEAAVTIVGAPLVYRMVLQKMQPDEALVETLVNCVVAGLSADSARQG
ncbi:TetR/AcrR family transcriptional regulator [Arthrobacter mangrovi]|uniref:TetR family transcriptional regulator n=1 Tax=Arthrobacter mangrovi TaxID=2966350 RepID=A0ABQ5MYV1_9MICC|nr:TetR/AcrR family transcriptional regulator [Arthrobacter mangrovi]GLB69171.1 TetR family transcriptional regulator [Arthrobacter mangrovi]